MAGLTDIETARALVLERVTRLEGEPVGLRDALGRVLYDDVTSADDVPGFDNSAMDGYAVRADDTRGASADAPVVLPLSGESRAGRPAPRPLEPGETFGISTGAMVPPGADAVVRVEDTTPGDGRVLIHKQVEAGAEIRRAGEDIRAGERVIEQGSRIGPAELGVLASVGIAQAPCARRPRVAVLSTGDELRDPGESLEPGQIRNTSGYAVPALAERSGAEIALVETVPDHAPTTQRAIARGLDAADVTVICGGVSVGEHDHVRPVLAELGCEEVFWGVALRPGRPTWFGTSPSGGLVFGLPGNPVSALVTFVLFTRPALLSLQGADPTTARGTAVLDEAYEKRSGRAHAVRCALRPEADGWHAELTRPAQGSHVLTSMLGADALAMMPADADLVAAGATVEVELLPSA